MAEVNRGKYNRDNLHYPSDLTCGAGGAFDPSLSETVFTWQSRVLKQVQRWSKAGHQSGYYKQFQRFAKTMPG